MSNICGRRRLAYLVFVTGVSGLRGFLEESKDIDISSNFRIADPLAVRAAFLEVVSSEFPHGVPTLEQLKKSREEEKNKVDPVRQKFLEELEQQKQRIYELRLELGSDDKIRERLSTLSEILKAANKAKQDKKLTLQDELALRVLEPQHAELARKSKELSRLKNELMWRARIDTTNM